VRVAQGEADSHAEVRDTVVRLEISSSVDLLTLVDAVSEQFARLAGLDDDAAHGLTLAVREAAANGIAHGNARDRGKLVRVSYALVTDLSQRRITVRVRDQGTGFDPHGLADPLAPENIAMTSGRGLLLMRAHMDDVQILVSPEGGNEIVMTKAIAGPCSKD
jgi:serine/threonine-protein kinase RsbW